MSGVYVCMYKQASKHARLGGGSGGMLPGNFRN